MALLLQDNRRNESAVNEFTSSTQIQSFNKLKLSGTMTKHNYITIMKHNYITIMKHNCELNGMAGEVFSEKYGFKINSEGCLHTAHDFF